MHSKVYISINDLIVDKALKKVVMDLITFNRSVIKWKLIWNIESNEK